MCQEDLPFTAEGITPDIIVNPHAIPSRMTIGHLVETLLAKTCAVKGAHGDGTPFQGTSVEAVSRELRAQGHDEFGRERLFSGLTGEPLEALVFIGPCYYQRLKHMVAYKWHSRGGFGPKAQLTRQPVEGRSRDGGLRFGEMEKDALTAHGAAHMLKDKLMDCSDKTTVFICGTCHHLAEPPPPVEFARIRGTLPFCRTCDSHNSAVRVEVPYAMKLLWQELEASGISLRPHVEPV